MLWSRAACKSEIKKKVSQIYLIKLFGVLKGVALAILFKSTYFLKYDFLLNKINVEKLEVGFL